MYAFILGDRFIQGQSTFALSSFMFQLSVVKGLYVHIIFISVWLVLVLYCFVIKIMFW